LPIEKFDLEQAVFIITAENGPFYYQATPDF